MVKQYYDKKTVAKRDAYENILVFRHIFITISRNIINKAL